MSKNTFTWRELLTREMRRHGESFADYVGMSPKDGEWLDIEMDMGMGGVGDGVELAPPFYLWTNERVYFATCYDQATGLASVPRFVSDEVPALFGGRGGLMSP